MAITPGGVRLRRPSPADLDALADLHAWSWRVTYGPLLSEEERALLTVEERRGVWARVLADPRPRESAWLAELDDRVAGLVWAGGAHDADAGVDPGVEAGEILAIHVEPGLHGRGIGGRLLDAAVGDLEDAGFVHATLWVIRENVEARRFYEGRGWQPDGAAKRAHMGDFAGLPIVEEVRYGLALIERGPPSATR